MIAFARDTGSRIIAEGVERQGELETLRSIGVKKVQGYLLGRPMDFDGAMKALAKLSKRDEAAASKIQDGRDKGFVRRRVSALTTGVAPGPRVG